MPQLVWDTVGERFYETGVKKGVLYPCDSTGHYPKGVAWNGLSSISENPSGAEANAVYADDIKYLNLYSAEEFSATIEAYTYPDEWLPCDGTLNGLDSSATAIDGVYVGQQTRQSFGLCYRTIIGNDTEYDDHAYKLHLIYGAKASPSERAYQTVNDSPEAISFSWEVQTIPVAISDVVDGSGVVHSFRPTSIITIDSRTVDPAKLKLLEFVLYGEPTASSGGTSPTAGIAGGPGPRLPLPDEVFSILA